MQAVQNFDNLGLESFFFLCTLLKVSRYDVSSFITLVLIIIDLEVITREFLNLADLFGVQILYVYEMAEVVVDDKYKQLMLKAL